MSAVAKVFKFEGTPKTRREDEVTRMYICLYYNPIDDIYLNFHQILANNLKQNNLLSKSLLMIP